MTIRSKVNAQKVRRRMWSVRGIGTMQRHFTVGNRGCPREKQGLGIRGPGLGFWDWGAIGGFDDAFQTPEIGHLDNARIPSPVSRAPSMLLIEFDNFARSLEAEFSDHARAIGGLVVHDFVGLVYLSAIHNLPFGGRHNFASPQE